MIDINERKTLLYNISWLVVLRVVSSLFPLLTIPYIANVIGVEKVGKVAFASIVAMWIGSVSDWGFEYSATRDMARALGNKREMQSIYSEVFLSKMILFFSCVFILFFLSFFVTVIKEEFLLLFFSVLSVPCKALSQEWFFRSVEKMKYITLLHIFIRSFFTLMVFFCIEEPSDYVYQPLLLTLGYFFSGIIASCFIYKNWDLKLKYTSLADVFKRTKEDAPVFLSSFVPNLYNSFSHFLLYSYKGGAASGSFDIGNKLFSFVNQLIRSVIVAFFPFLSKKIQMHRLFSIVAISLSILAAIVLYYMGPWALSTFFNEDLQTSKSVLRILSLSLPFLTISSVYGTNYLVLVGKESLYSKIVMLISIIGFVASFPMVLSYGAIGVALLLLMMRIATSISVYSVAKWM